ncbi:hypothetical protein [Erwinia tasmaniensis]|uniref:hypothetical protein n=1 Tax=Erwinia tasmaniensis TaxID=338565 RepID=UPI003A4D63A3
MSNFLTPAAAYLNRRNELLAERSVVDSPVVIQTVNKALMASEIAMATFHDLETLRSLQLRKARPIEQHSLRIQQELQQFELASNQLALTDTADEAAYLTYQSAFFQLNATFPWQYASLQRVQNELFATTFTLWQETLEELFTSKHRRLLFVRVEKILAFSISKIPVLGEALAVYQQLVTAMQASHQRAQETDDYFRSLESYSDAATLCSRSILIFCFTAEAVLRGRPLPDEVQLNKRVKTHHQSVIEGTHPYF